MLSRQVIGGAVITGIIGGIVIHSYQLAYPAEVVYASNEEIELKAQVIQIATVIDWTSERIEKEIRDTFPEAPNVAVAIAKCESGLEPDIQSQHTLSYGRERSFGIFQIHEPDWKALAIKLDLPNWRTDPKENIQLARAIYDQAGQSWKPWSCLKMI